jgi:hypothetical protein
MIGFVVFSFVNILFSVKYFSRVTDYYWILAAVVLCVHSLIFVKGDAVKRFLKHSTAINILLLAGFCIFSFVVFKKIPVETLNVDRWSVITSFWDNYFNGEYVYYAQSHDNNYPGAMPFYFVLALPFYFLGELGYFSMLGIVVFYLMMKYMKVEASTQTLFLLLVMTSPFFVYEIMVRSPLFLNASLIAFSMLFFFRLKDYHSLKNQMMIGLITGFLVSTRNIFALCYVILFLYFLKTGKINIVSTLKIGVLSILFFSITFLPFTVGHFDDFLKVNPLIVLSSTLMPFTWALAVAVCSSVLILFCKKDIDAVFYGGLALFATIVLYFVNQIMTNSFEVAYYGSNADVSYFIFCVPFFLCYVLSENFSRQSR